MSQIKQQHLTKGFLSLGINMILANNIVASKKKLSLIPLNL